MRLKNICVITDGYPSEHYVINAFVETLVNEMTDQGVNCVVIAPQSVTNAAVYGRKLLPYKRQRTSKEGNPVTVYTPKYVTLSSKKFGGFNSNEFGLLSFRNACEKVFREISDKVEFDAIYGHFIFPAGITANYLGKKYGAPSFFAYGENTTYTIDYLGCEKTRKLLEGVNGVISVSTENKRVLVDNRMADESRIEVFPNSVDRSVFFPHDKEACRKELHLPTEGFTVAFVGRFLDVKGPDRLCSALRMLDDDINAIFIGSGSLKPDYDGTVFCGEVQHGELPKYLSAADVFVLPTKAEGCCNAIIEAMACGLPIISSDRPFNYDILSHENAVLVEPSDAAAIASAIDRIKNDPLRRERLSSAALKTAEKLDISTRAQRIRAFIEANC